MSTTNILDLNNRIDALEKIANNVEPIQQQIDELKAWTDPGTKDATGNPIILTDGAELEPTALTVTLEESQDGYTECVIDRVGKNLLDESQLADNDIEYLPIKVGSGNFTLSTTAPRNTSNNANLFLLAGNVSSGINTGTNGVWNGQSRTVEAVDGYVTVGSRNVDGVTIKDYNTILEPGNTATAYVPYAHDTATITFGETVNAGSVDFITGIVTVTSPEAKTLTLTPDNITLLKGYNVISSAGNIALSYYPNLGLALDNRIAALEEKMSQLAGGTTGQVLTKTSNDDYDVGWETLPATRTTTKKSEK